MKSELRCTADAAPLPSTCVLNDPQSWLQLVVNCVTIPCEVEPTALGQEKFTQGGGGSRGIRPPHKIATRKKEGGPDSMQLHRKAEHTYQYRPKNENISIKKEIWALCNATAPQSAMPLNLAWYNTGMPVREPSAERSVSGSESEATNSGHTENLDKNIRRGTIEIKPPSPSLDTALVRRDTRAVWCLIPG